jgi:hypothetical protein
MEKKVLILKNDRTGDLFVSLKAINRIINKHSNQEISIYLSKTNHKFHFLFPNLKKTIVSMNLTLVEKIKLFLFLVFNPIDCIYILSPKNFYYYLPLFFRKIKFYGLTIKSQKSRPANFLLKYLFKFVVIDRLNISKRKSSYNIQENLIENVSDKNNLNKISNVNHNFIYPKNFVFFHYKHTLFAKLLNWDLYKINKLLNFLSDNFENVVFSSELFNVSTNKFFFNNFNTFDFVDNKEYQINKKNIFFLKDIDGYNLFDAVNKSSKIICPEGIITHMGYFLNKPSLALLHFNLNTRRDFINQIISCKEWFPPNNYDYTVLKKDFNKSLDKLIKRI